MHHLNAALYVYKAKAAIFCDPLYAYASDLQYSRSDRNLIPSDHLLLGYHSILMHVTLFLVAAFRYNKLLAFGLFPSGAWPLASEPDSRDT
jgi:hypothetical protein